MDTRTRRARKCMLRLTLWDTCSLCASDRPTRTTERSSRSSPRRYKKRPGRTSSWPTSIRDTRARRPQSPPEHGIRLEVVKHEEAKGGFVLLPRRWVVERDFAWASRFRRLVKDYERLPETLAGLHFVAFACLFLQQAAGILLTGS